MEVVVRRRRLRNPRKSSILRRRPWRSGRRKRERTCTLKQWLQRLSPKTMLSLCFQQRETGRGPVRRTGIGRVQNTQGLPPPALNAMKLDRVCHETTVITMKHLSHLLQLASSRCRLQHSTDLNLNDRLHTMLPFLWKSWHLNRYRCRSNHELRPLRNQKGDQDRPKRTAKVNTSNKMHKGWNRTLLNSSLAKLLPMVQQCNLLTQDKPSNLARRTWTTSRSALLMCHQGRLQRKATHDRLWVSR